jgi:hypothetical protein
LQTNLKQQRKMHWKKLINPEYLGAYSLEDNGAYKNKVVTIESVSLEAVTGAGGASEQCMVARLVGEKPLILNRTNAKTIERVLKTPDINQWSGKQIELCVERVKAFGDVTDAIRVVPKAPQLPELNEQHKHWTAVVEGLKAKKTDLQRLKTKYTISALTEKALQNGAS